MKKVAIIDDDPIFSLMLKKNFEQNANVKEVMNFQKGQDAFLFLIDHFDKPEVLPDLVFVDLNMPLWDGWEFLRSVNSLSLKFAKKIKFYVLSSFYQPDDLQQIKQLTGIEDYIEKPGSLVELRQLIEDIIH